MYLTSLRSQILGSVAATLLLSAAAPVLAGDLSNRAAGGIRDYGNGGVPVPAPMPYEETYKWYVRGDIGSAFKSSGKIDAPTTFGSSLPVSQPENWSALSILSFGFGRYLTPALRTEFTLDYRPQRTLQSGQKSLGVSTRSIRVADSGTPPVVTLQTNWYNGTSSETTDYQNTTLLMSAFYDFNREGRFKPYIGAGVGLARHELSRNGTQTFTCFDGYLEPNGVAPIHVGCAAIPGTPSLDLKYVSKSADVATGWGLAAQVSAGVSYDLSARAHWDTGYRMLWQSGNVSSVSADGISTIKINSRIDHELRTGLRLDIW